MVEHQAFAALTRHHREAAICPRPYSPCTIPLPPTVLRLLARTAGLRSVEDIAWVRAGNATAHALM